jgi:hypothetical protein
MTRFPSREFIRHDAIGRHRTDDRTASDGIDGIGRLRTASDGIDGIDGIGWMGSDRPRRRTASIEILNCSVDRRQHRGRQHRSPRRMNIA